MRKSLVVYLIISVNTLSSINVFAYSTNNDGWVSPVSDVSFDVKIDASMYENCSTDYINWIRDFQKSISSNRINKAISTWGKLDPYRTCMQTSSDYPTSTLFWNYVPMGTPIMPEYAMMKKVHKNGILYIGRHCSSNCSPSDYYIGFIKVKNWMFHIYNTPLAPMWSKQFATYKKLYNPQTYTGNTDSYTALYKDLLQAFKNGKFNNSNTNSVYKKFIDSIR